LQSINTFSPAIPGTQYDILAQLKKGDLSLLKMPARLLFPKPIRDAYLGVYLSNILVLLGIGFPFLKWRNRRDLKNKDLIVFILSIVTVFQIGATIVIGSLIAILHYFFVQRLFIYLIVCHALLATVGAYYLLSHNKKILNPLMKGILLVMFCFSLNWHWQYYSQISNMRPTKLCQVAANDLDDAWRKLDVKWRKVNESNFPKDTPKNYAFGHLFYIVERNHYLKKCGWNQAPHTEDVSLCKTLTGVRSINEKSHAVSWDRPVYFDSKK